MRERFKKGEMIKILPFLYGLLMLAMAGLVVNYRYFGNRVGIVEKVLLKVKILFQLHKINGTRFLNHILLVHIG